MLADLERLIHLQDIETKAAAAAKAIADAPGRIAALDATIHAAQAAVDAAKKDLADNATARRSIDNDLLAVRQRLDKYKDQLMAVKTNDEYRAMQHQTAAAVAEIDRHEERLLERMLAADEISARLKKAQSQLTADQAAVAAERAAIEAESKANHAMVGTCAGARAALVAQLDRGMVETFERVARARSGIAVARAEKEFCTVCKVRLRPMVYNTVIRNDQIVQCDSCQRILYFVAPKPESASA